MPKTNFSSDVAVILTKLSRIERDIQDINGKLDKDYVTQDQFEPVKRLVYGMVSVVLLSFVGAVVALVVRTP